VGRVPGSLEFNSIQFKLQNPLPVKCTVDAVKCSGCGVHGGVDCGRPRARDAAEMVKSLLALLLIYFIEVSAWAWPGV